MERLAAGLLAGTWMALAAAGAGAAEEADPVLADMGATQYATYCAACHGADARGEGPVASALKTPPPDLTRIAARRGGVFPTGEIARFIDGRFDVTAHGPREMPVWGERFTEGIPEPGVGDEVSRGRVVTLVAYLQSIQRGD
jgi:mono/diheme cytochrome c family protein